MLFMSYKHLMVMEVTFLTFLEHKKTNNATFHEHFIISSFILSYNFPLFLSNIYKQITPSIFFNRA